MAAISRSIGKRLSPQTQIWSWKSTPSASSLAHSRRNGHSSSAPAKNPEQVATAYEKNPDDPVPQNAVPDEVIQIQSEEYWVPHPQTGVFVPPSDCNLSEDGHEPEEESVPEQEAWYRPTDMEDLEQPISLQVEEYGTRETPTRQVAEQGKAIVHRAGGRLRWDDTGQIINFAQVFLALFIWCVLNMLRLGLGLAQFMSKRRKSHSDHR